MKPYLLVAVMSAGVLAACGGSASDAADTGPADLSASSPETDGAGPVDSDTPDDGTATDVSADVGDAFALPPIESWLLLTPTESLTEADIAVQPALAWDGAGRLAVAWTGRVAGVSGIVGGLFEMARTPFPVTGPDMLTSIETGLRNEPQLCALEASASATNGFVGVWSVDLQNGSADNLGIYVRTFDADLSPVTSTESLVDTGRPGNHWLGRVACDATGGFAVGGVRAGVGGGFEAFAQRYDAAGAASGAPLVGLERETGSQLFPAVALDADDLWLAWEDTPDVDMPAGILVRHFEATGPTGLAMDLDAVFPRPAAGVAVVAAGGAVLISAVASDGLAFAYSGKGEAFAPVAFADRNSGAGGVAMAPIGPGEFAVVWTRAAAGTNRDVRFATFRDGAFDGAPVTLATGRFPAAYRPAISVRDGRLAIAFTESLGGGAWAVRVAIGAL